MDILSIFLLYIVTLVLFLIIDFLWLGVIAKSFYSYQLGYILKSKVNWPPAAIFYLLFIIGILFFAVFPGLDVGSWSKTALSAGLLGLLCYGTYGLSNLATLKNWPRIVVIVDIIWGTFLTTVVALASYFFGQLVG